MKTKKEVSGQHSDDGAASRRSMICDCGNVAIKLMQGDPICQRCMDMQRWNASENVRRGKYMEYDRRLERELEMMAA